MKIDSNLVAKVIRDALKYYELQFEDIELPLTDDEKGEVIERMSELNNIAFSIAWKVKQVHPRFDTEDFTKKATGR